MWLERRENVKSLDQKTWHDTWEYQTSHMAKEQWHDKHSFCLYQDPVSKQAFSPYTDAFLLWARRERKAATQDPY